MATRSWLGLAPLTMPASAGRPSVPALHCWPAAPAEQGRTCQALRHDADTHSLQEPQDRRPVCTSGAGSAGAKPCTRCPAAHWQLGQRACRVAADPAHQAPDHRQAQQHRSHDALDVCPTLPGTASWLGCAFGCPGAGRRAVQPAHRCPVVYDHRGEPAPCAACHCMGRARAQLDQPEARQSCRTHGEDGVRELAHQVAPAGGQHWHGRDDDAQAEVPAPAP